MMPPWKLPLIFLQFLLLPSLFIFGPPKMVANGIPWPRMSHRPPSLKMLTSMFGRNRVERCSCEKRRPLSSMRLIDQQRQIYVDHGSFAEGSQGKIYHGYHGGLGHCIVIKSIYYALESDLRDMAQREVDALYYMAHLGVQYVVRLIDDVDYADLKMYALFLELGAYTLQQYWQNFMAQPRSDEQKIGEIKTLIAQLLNAYVELHNAGIIHMDFKMENAIMQKVRGPNGQQYSIVKLIDFAGAQLTGTTTDVDRPVVPNNTVVGSPDYAAPEQKMQQIYSGLVSTKTDIWAIGCVLFQMLIGWTANLFFWRATTYRQVQEEMENLEDYLQGELRKPEWTRERKILYFPLLHMAKACLHADPMKRPRAYELLGYLHGWCRLSVSGHYGGGPGRAFDGSTSEQTILCKQMSQRQFRELAASQGR